MSVSLPITTSSSPMRILSSGFGMPSWLSFDAASETGLCFTPMTLMPYFFLRSRSFSVLRAFSSETGFYFFSVSFLNTRTCPSGVISQ